VRILRIVYGSIDLLSTAIASIAEVMSSKVTSAEPSARLGTAGSSVWMPRLLAISITRSTPTASISCTATVFIDWAKAVRNVTGPR
jgi:hypothetical protein